VEAAPNASIVERVIGDIGKATLGKMMTKSFSILFVACGLVAIVSSPASAAYVNGQDLNDWANAYDRASAGVGTSADFAPASELRGFVIGTYDQLELSMPVGKCFINPTKGQLTSIVTNYVRAHPEQWDRPGVRLVYAAFAEACRKKQPAG
jgi:hypothetical protein